MLLQQHLDAGCIQPSSALAGSGAFIIPKVDPTTLPCWVNDYHQLNTNTITDSFPIPRISEILADVVQGKIFVSLSMTNSLVGYDDMHAVLGFTQHCSILRHNVSAFSNKL